MFTFFHFMAQTSLTKLMNVTMHEIPFLTAIILNRMYCKTNTELNPEYNFNYKVPANLYEQIELLDQNNGTVKIPEALLNL